MRTTVDLDETLLRQAMKQLGVRTKTAALEAGLREVLRRAAGEQLIALGGKIPGARAAPRRRINFKLK